MRLAQPSALVAAVVLLGSGAFATADPVTEIDPETCYLDYARIASRSASEIADLASCGDAGSIQYCLAFRQLQEVEKDVESMPSLRVFRALTACYIDAGCTLPEAMIETNWQLRKCIDPSQPDALSLRQKSKQHLPAATPAITPAPAATEVAELLGEADPVLRIQQRADAISSTTSLVCQSVTTVSTTVCPIQTTGANAGKERLSCYPTVVSFPTCIAGLMCTMNSLGAVTCMKKVDGLDGLGVAIAIVFGAGIVIAVTAMCFFCCRERRQHARELKAADAAAIAKQAAVERKRPTAAVRNVSTASNMMGSGDAQPLMAAGGGDVHDMPPVPSIYTSDSTADITGPNPFADRQQLR